MRWVDEGFEVMLGLLGGAGQDGPDLVVGELKLEVKLQQGARHAQVGGAGGGIEAGLGVRVHGKALHPALPPARGGSGPGSFKE